MSKRITELPLATQLNTEDQFIFYSNSAKETQRVNAGISLNVIASNLPGVLKATTNASLAVANAAVAQAAASAAQADATTAIGDAAGAQSSADGKNKIFYQTEPPTNPISGYALRENDLWYDINNGYKMSKWSGSVWTEYQLDDQALAGLNVGKLTAGFISSKIIELSDSTAYIQSSSYIQTWVSGMPCSVYNESLQYNGKETPSHNVRCKVKQENGTYKVFNCLNVAGSTNAPAASGNNTWWSEIAVPTVSVDVGGEATNIPNFGFRVVGQGTAEFSAATFTGNIQTNTGFFGSGKNIVRIGSNGLTIGNSGYIKSDGVTYGEISPSVIDFSGNGFFLGNTQGEGQDNAYQFYIGNRITSKYLRWDGTNLIINGRIATGSTLGDSNSGSLVNSQGGIVVGSKIGIRRNVDTDILTITGGTDNWATSGAGQIDLTGIGAQAPGSTLVLGVVQIIGGKTDTGDIFLRTWNGTNNLVNYNNCLTASRNGSVGINDTAPSNSNGIKLDVYGSMRIREGVVYSTYTEYSGYTVALNDGINNIRFQNNNVGLYAKVGSAADVLIASPKLNLSSQQILAPFSFATSQGTTGALVISDTNLTWDSNGTLSNGSGIVINPNGIVGALNGVAKFTITKSGDATFAGALSAPTGNFGGWTIGNTNISGGNITIDSSANNGYIATGQTAYNTGTGFWVGSVSGTAKLSVGNSAGNYLTWDGSSLSIKGSITLVNTIPSGSVSGLGTLATQNSISYGSLTGTKPPENADVTLSAIQGSLTLTGGGLVLASGGASIRGGQTAFNTGTGFFLGDVSGTTKFSLGNSAGNYLTWDGSTLTVNGNINVTGGNASTQTYAQGVASSAANSAQSAAASDATAKANSAQSTAIGVAASDATTKANAAQAVAISAAASDATTKANAAQATSIQAASLDATLKANTAYTNAKAIADGVAQGTYSNGTFISGQSIFSPVIAGVNGYFSNSFKVGNNGITLDGVNKSIYIGTGTYANANTGFYVDSNAYFSLKDKLYWNPATSTLTVQGNIVSSSIDSNSSVGGRNAGTIAGAIDSGGIITSAALNSKLDTAAGTILGQFALTGSGALQIGTYTNGSSGDIRITPNGITARNSSGATTFSLDGTTGAAIFKGDITGASGTFSGTLSATVGTIGGLTIASSRLHSGTKASLNDAVNGFYLGTDGVSVRDSSGSAALEIVNTRGRFTTRNASNIITGAFQGEDTVTGSGGSFLFLANGTGVDTISFFGGAGFGYFTTFYDSNDTNYYCNPASTSVFAGLDVGGYAVLTTNSGAVTAGASTNFGQLQVNDWLTFDNSQTRLSISKDFNLGSENYLTYAGGDIGHRWVNSGNTTQLALLNNSGDLSVTGALSKGSGSFRIEHPLPSKAATHELVHSFIEGPRCGLIYSGKINLVNGIATINIDADSTMTEGTFEALCKNVHCFTTNETGWGAIRGKVVGNMLTIEAQDLTSTDSVSWMVIGERKDKHIMDTDWTDENGRPIVEPLKK